MNTALDYQKIEAQIVDGVVTEQEFNQIMAEAEIRTDNGTERHGYDLDGDLVVLTKVNDYQVTYVRTSRKGATNEKEVGLFARIITKDAIEGKITIKKLY